MLEKKQNVQSTINTIIFKVNPLFNHSGIVLKFHIIYNGFYATNRLYIGSSLPHFGFDCIQNNFCFAIVIGIFSFLF